MRAIALLSVSGLLLLAVSCGGSSSDGSEGPPPSGNDVGGSAAAGAAGGSGANGGTAGATSGHGGASGGGASGAGGHVGGGGGQPAGGGGGQSAGGKEAAGGASSGPATCADAHGPTGCCSADGTTVYYFDGTAVRSSACVGGTICGWDASNAYYACGSSGSPDPSGANPETCGGDGAGNGQCPAGTGGNGGAAGSGGAAGTSGTGATGGKGGAGGKAGASGASGHAGTSGSAGMAGSGSGSSGASGAAGTASSAGASGAAGAAGSTGKGGAAGTAGSAGAAVSTTCANCLLGACAAQVSACENDSTCFACDGDYTAASCAPNAAFQAVAACGCAQCAATGCVNECKTLSCDAPPVVISQVYGGGGNGAGLWLNDFVELYNRSNAPIVIDGWAIQYASSSGIFSSIAPLAGTIPPGHYYLIALSSGGGTGQPLPQPDASGAINVASYSGKVALVRSTTPISGCSDPSVIDLVGYGTVSCSEGAAAPMLSGTTAALRNGGGCSDTNVNANDFTAAPPNPRNSASAALTCASCD